MLFVFLVILFHTTIIVLFWGMFFTIEIPYATLHQFMCDSCLFLMWMQDSVKMYLFLAMLDVESDPE